MKKNFTGGLNSLLQSTKTEQEETAVEVKEKPSKAGRPKTNTKEIKKTSEIGTKEGEIRATFIVLEENLEKIKALAYWEREQIKDIVNQAFTDYIKKFEKQKGEIKPVPKK